MCENIISKFKQKLKINNIKNIGILVINNKTGKVEVWIGGHEYENKDESMIDAVTMKRSPGSTLKPFLYGKAIDSGLITPKSIIFDVERYYSGYQVLNYDKKFHGPVTAAAALTYSLNSPAVYLLSKLNKGSFLSIVDSLGYDLKSFKGNIGLSVALGAHEISLFNLTKNYTALANNGKVKDVFYTDKKIHIKGKKLLSTEAAFLISEMLSEGTRLDLPKSWEYTLRNNKIAWKTGTSFGNYDALCIGYNADYTIGVWLGNANRKPSKALVGVSSAAPILFNLFNAITYNKDSWFKKPSSIKIRKVSTASGKLPTQYTKHLIYDYYIPGISSMETCKRYRAYYINKNTGYAVVKTNNRKVKKLIIEVYPKEAVSWAKKNILSYKSPPSYEPDQLKYVNSEGRLKILSPLGNNIYYLNKHLSNKNQKIPLLIEPYPDTEKLYWFINGSLFTSGSVNKGYYLKPKVGKYTLMCVDDKGRSGSVNLEIKLIR